VVVSQFECGVRSAECGVWNGGLRNSMTHEVLNSLSS
jgi:hypothetical protein